MIDRLTVLALASTALAGCMTMSGNEAAPTQPATGICDASAVQQFVGQRASQQTGDAILAQSGAKTLRWGPPDSMWTMDYREDRVNVRYDRDMAITAVTCG